MAPPGRAFIGRTAVLPDRAFAIAARPGRDPSAGRPCREGLHECNRAAAQPTAIQSGMACRQGITYKAKYSIIVILSIVSHIMAGMAYRQCKHIKE